MPGWNPAVPKAIATLQHLRDTCSSSPSQFLTPEDIDVVLGPLKFINEHRNGPMPALDVFAPSSKFSFSLRRIMWTYQRLAEGHYAVWGAYFTTMNMLSQLVLARNEAAFLKYGELEDPDDGLTAYRQYVRPYDQVVAGICRAQRCTHWPEVHNWGVQFVSQQLFAHVVAQSSSGSDMVSFTAGMQREVGAMYLALLYQELDDERVLAAARYVRAITVLGIAKGITLPYDGVKTQSAFAAHLAFKWDGQITAQRVASLSIAQIHVLWSPFRVWPQANFFCHHCSQEFDREHPCRACKGCWRAVYCSTDCQRSDWKPVHRIACKLWRLVAEREAFRKVRKALKKLPLDPIEHFPM